MNRKRLVTTFLSLMIFAAGTSSCSASEAAMCQTNQIFALDTPLYSKLKYYCDCIRNCFDTTGWPKYTAWEKVLQK